MQVELRPIGDIKPYDKNPRVNDGAVDAVAKSLTEFGFRQPIVVDADGVIVVGHTRWKAAMKLGLERVPVHVASELTPAQAKAYRIADNQTATIAEWDFELLPIEIGDLKAMDFDLDLLGFSEPEMTEIMAPPENIGLVDPDDAPEPPDEAVTRPGDLWVLGEHRLLSGDSTREGDVATVMNGEKAGLVLTDPPYGVSYVGKTAQALEIQNDGADGLRPLLDSAFARAIEACEAGAVWYVAAPAGPQFGEFACALSALGVWRQTLVWVKDSMVLGHSDYHYRHEAIFYGWKPGAVHRVPPDRTRTTVLEFARPKASREHPTMKPVDLWACLMSASSGPGDIAYEPFSGSGTTILAAEQLGRRCRAIEIEPRYADVAVRRWQAFTGRSAVLEGDGRTFDEVAEERGVAISEPVASDATAEEPA